MFVLRLFGGASVEGDAGVLTGQAAQRHRLALLALLAAHHPGALSRDKAVAYLWPERDAERARNLLNQAVHALRRALGEGAVLSSGDDLRLDPGAVGCDVVAFAEALAAGERERAVAAYGGPFLDGFFLPHAPEFERWAAGERERHAAAHRGALRALAEEAAARGDTEGAVDWWRRLAAQDPYNARVTLGLMEALAAAGDRAGAIQQARVHAALLAQEFEAVPDPEVAALAERLRTAPPVDEMKTVEAVPTPDFRAPRDEVAPAPDARAPVVPAVVASTPSRARASVGRRAAALTGAVALALLGLLGVARLRQASGSHVTAPAPPAVAGPDARPWRSSLAVLPLKNYSSDPAQDAFADGMTEELTTTLTKIEALRVIAHQSVLRFKHSDRPVPEIARALDVKYLVDGSVLQDGGRVRITANLIDAATSAPVWGERFERERGDVLALQREVALAIARAIEVALTPQDRARLADAPAVDPEAFDLYVQGTQARYRGWSDRDVAAAEAYFARAVARDSSFAPAVAGLAEAHAMAGDAATGRALAERALALDPRLAEAHVARGMIQEFYEWDWAGAEASFRRAIALNPGFAEAHHELSMLLMRRRRFDEALGEAQRAVYLAPMSVRFQNGLAEVLCFAGRYDAALRESAKAVALDSAWTGSYWLQGLVHEQQGRYDAAETAWRKCVALRCAEVSSAGGEFGHLYAVSGRRAQARAVVDTLTARWHARGAAPSPWTTFELAIQLAQVHAGLGERERALDWLERAAGSGAFMLYLGIDPYFRPLHAEPRFQAVLRRVGLDR